MGTPRLTPAGDEVVLTLPGEAEFHTLRQQLEVLLAADERLRSSTTLVLDLGGCRLTQEQLVQLEEVVSRRLGPRLLHVVSEEVTGGSVTPAVPRGPTYAVEADGSADPPDQGQDPAGVLAVRSVGDSGSAETRMARRNGLRPGAGEGIPPTRTGNARPRRTGRTPAIPKAPMAPSAARGRPLPSGHGASTGGGHEAGERAAVPNERDQAPPAAATRDAPAAKEAVAPRNLGQPVPPPQLGRRHGTVLVRHTLRSGHRLVYDGDVVIVGDVNPGAEVIASGDVVVFGRLRGIVHAGVRGDEGAVVASLVMQPVQLRIAGAIARAPDGEPAAARPGAGRSQGGSGPEVAYLRQGRVVIEPFDPMQWRGWKKESQSRGDLTPNRRGGRGV